MPESINTHFASAKPKLSVLIPFHKDDPTPLLLRLFSERNLRDCIEIIVLDDGTRSQNQTRSVTDLIDKAEIPSKLIVLEQNIGRAAGRNRLADNARGQYLLFIDADMLPDSDDFLAQWLFYALAETPATAFGGLTLKQATCEKQYAVHRAMAAQSDCVPAAKRALQPEKYLFTSNLLIRRDIYDTHPFDKAFSGWGWEDVEWAMRVSKSHEIQHPDIPATHTGLDLIADLKRKYKQAAANFSRLIRLHPDFTAHYPSYKAAQTISRFHLAIPIEKLAEFVSDLEFCPVKIRALSLRFYRAAQYAKALKT